jgi:glutamate synthase (NADPH/NADH) small chain
MALEKVRMPEQHADVRNKNFLEVALGYDEAMAAEEAGRCLRCKNRPCVAGCPVNVAIPDFISLVAGGRFDEAYAVIKDSNALPAICGRVCPQETQCEQLCVRGRKGEPVAVGRLERFLGDRQLAKETATAAAAAPAAGDANACGAESAASDACAASAVPAAPYAIAASVAGSMPAAASSAGSPTAGDAPVAGSAPAFPAEGKAPAAASSAVDLDIRGRKAAVIGSGPASLTCAGDLAKQGVKVTIFEAFHVAGGVLMYGIPEFRLPKQLVQQEISQLKALGVSIELDVVVGKTLDVDDLWEDGYEAIFIGTGAGLPSFMRIPGENLCGVYSANEYLTRVNLMKGYRFPDADTPVMRGRNVAVFGGGNVAMDAARCAKRLGADNVYIVYRRSEKEMPARAEEARHAAEEGIEFRLLTNPTRILGNGDGWVKGIECLRMELGEPDASGRRRPAAVRGSEFEIAADTVVVAIGQSPNPIIRNSLPELRTESWGGIVTDEATGATSIEGIYAGGDAVTGAATVILAMGAGKAAAKAMCGYLRSKPRTVPQE